jgi:hypothetical protein
VRAGESATRMSPSLLHVAARGGFLTRLTAYIPDARIVLSDPLPLAPGPEEDFPLLGAWGKRIGTAPVPPESAPALVGG